MTRIGQAFLGQKISDPLRLASLAFILLCGAFLLLRLYLEWLAGGSGWQQGDWLINMNNTPIRRGAFGSALIFLSDVVGVSPLDMVFLTQAALLLILLASLMFVFSRILENPAYSIIIFSPGFFLNFWVADPPGALRKELIAFAAMALLLVVPLLEKRRTALAGISVALFLVACIGHEANVLLTPAYAAIFLVAVSPDVRSLSFRLMSVAFLLVVGSSLLWASLHPGVADFQAICEPLSIRGVDSSICEGAISWLERDTSFGFSRVAEVMLESGRIYFFLIAYAAAVGPFLYLNALHGNARFLNVALLLSILPVLPLYPIAQDWGRWMDFHIVSYSFFLVALVVSGRVSIRRSPNMFVLLGLIAATLLWAPAHAPGLPRYTGGIAIGGVIGQFFSSVSSVLFGSS
jgi:hypothetical protein